MRYTARSLSGQTRSDFLAFIYYLDETEPLIRASLARHEPLPPHIEFVPFSKRKERMDGAMQGYDKAYVSRIDSDKRRIYVGRADIEQDCRIRRGRNGRSRACPVLDREGPRGDGR